MIGTHAGAHLHVLVQTFLVQPGIEVRHRVMSFAQDADADLYRRPHAWNCFQCATFQNGHELGHRLSCGQLPTSTRLCLCGSNILPMARPHVCVQEQGDRGRKADRLHVIVVIKGDLLHAL